MIATVKQIKDIKVIKDLIILKIDWKGEEVFPGQFFMLGAETILNKDFLLNRPFSVSNFNKEILEFRIRITGKFTNYLSKLSTEEHIRIIGPLGHYEALPFYKNFKEIILIGGGIGIAPLIYFYNFFKKNHLNVKIYYGCKDKESLHYISDVQSNINVYTEDGSYGEKGFATDVLNNYSRSNGLIIACGPHAMYKTLKKYSHLYKIKILVEERMACGFGVCLGCVVDTVEGYKRVCREGPLFDINYLTNF